MPAQGERRRGGGDWDSHAEDVVVGFVEPDPGEQCAERIAAYADGRTARCNSLAPVGLSICTPCHRRRLKERARRLSLEHRQRIADQTGRPLKEIR